MGFVRAYHASLMHYHQYFTQQATRCADEGSIAEVIEALAPLALNVPLLLVSDVVHPSRLRSILFHRLMHGPSTHRPSRLAS